jgi:hypothetical protein
MPATWKYHSGRSSKAERGRAPHHRNPRAGATLSCVSLAILLVLAVPAHSAQPVCRDHYNLVHGLTAETVQPAGMVNLTRSVIAIKLERFTVTNRPPGTRHEEYWATLENHAGKSVISYTTLFASVPPDSDLIPADAIRHNSCAQGYPATYHVPLWSREFPVTGLLAAVLFSDGTFEGDARVGEWQKFLWLGYRIAQQRIEKILTGIRQSGGRDLAADRAEAEDSIKALPGDPFDLEGSMPASAYDAYRAAIEPMRVRTLKDPLANARWSGMKQGLEWAKVHALSWLRADERSPELHSAAQVIEVTRAELPPEAVIRAAIGPAR